MGSMGTLFQMVYPWSPQKISSVGIFVISNVYFDRTIKSSAKNVLKHCRSVFSLQLKSGESTKHYLTQVLLVINGCYLQEGKNSRMLIEVQCRLMQTRFIEIHQVFAKKRSDTFLTEWYIRVCWTTSIVINVFLHIVPEVECTIIFR